MYSSGSVPGPRSNIKHINENIPLYPSPDVYVLVSRAAGFGDGTVSASLIAGSHTRKEQGNVSFQDRHMLICLSEA